MMNDEYPSLSPRALWLCHTSCMSWSDPDLWVDYFNRVQEIMGAEITNLDDNDPVRRRVNPNGLAEAAELVGAFGDGETSRWLSGKMAEIGVDFSINHYRNDPSRDNDINWHAPPEVFEDSEQVAKIIALFDCGNQLLDAFYGFADTCERQVRKKKEWAVCYEDELSGIFWLTYFNEKYVSFFGEDRFRTLDQLGVDVQLDQGATLQLAETPDKVPEGLRRKVEIHLGEKSFVNPDPKDFTVKHPGQYALTFEQLRA